MQDNPSIDEDYEAKLSALDPFTAAQLRDGNWLIQPGRGVFYKRDWFEVVDAAATKLTEDAKAAAITTLRQTLGVVMAALDASLGWPAKNIFARVREELRARGLL